MHMLYNTTTAINMSDQYCRVQQWKWDLKTRKTFVNIKICPRMCTIMSYRSHVVGFIMSVISHGRTR